MVKVNLEKILDNANKVVESQSNNEFSDRHKIVYPTDGTIKVRLLYNEKSGLVIRQIKRHKIAGEKVACMSQYGQDCLICKTLTDIENSKSKVPWSMKSTSRGIAYAEYVDSNYTWDNPQYTPEKGEIILFMFPWSVYSDISRLINSAGDHLEKLIASNEGGVFEVTKIVDKGQIRYRTAIDPFDTAHKTRSSQEEYEKLLSELPNLNESVLPSKVTQEIIDEVRDTANQLTTEYLSTTISSAPSGEVLSSHIENNNNIITNSGAPSCFGKHNDKDINPNQCLMCPQESDCLINS